MFFFFLQNEEHLEEGRILSPLSSQFRVLPTKTYEVENHLLSEGTF